MSTARPADPLAWLTSLEGVPSAYAATRDGIDTLLRDRGLRRTSPELTAESLLRGAHASAVLEGSTTTLEELRAGEGDEVALGALRLSTELLGLVPTLRRTPAQALARLHALAAAGLVTDPAALGRPDPAGAPRLAALADALTAPSDAPALVVAAVVHGEVATSGAFPQGAGLVARAAARLTMAARGLDPQAVSVPEVGHVEIGGDAYRTALRAYAGGGADGIAAWVAHCAEATVLGAREGVAVCEAIQRGA
jgi:hypothetical protein